MIKLVRVDDQAFAEMWNHLMVSGNHFDALYGEKNLAYYQERCGKRNSRDLSFLLVDDLDPICGLRVFSRALESDGNEIACFGLPILYAEKSHVDQLVLSNARRIMRSSVRDLLKESQSNTIAFHKDRLARGCLSPISRCLLDLGGQATPSISQIIDLSLPKDDIFKGLTKAYKSAVKGGVENLELKVIAAASINSQDIEQFRLLHAEAAGRETRTMESWNLQHQMVLAGEAFCVFAKLEGLLVSAALFPHSRSHCFYGVSASRRDMFHKPLSHSVIWTAILHAKKLVLRDFEMGEQLFPMIPRENPSEKELGISFFKRAFGGEPRVSLDVTLKLDTKTMFPPTA